MKGRSAVMPSPPHIKLFKLIMNKSKVCVFLDAGHGGIDPRGHYTTWPDKMFLHAHSNRDFHDGKYFYEGVSNRIITYKVSELLNKQNINNIIVSHPYEDTSLYRRVKLANAIAPSFNRTLYISNHSNASFSGRARGFEIFTSPGVTQSDLMARIYWNEFSNKFPDVKMRSGNDNGQHDKEEKFYVLIRTIMPAILTEHFFFDNEEDAVMLMDTDIQNRIAKVQVDSIREFFKI